MPTVRHRSRFFDIVICGGGAAGTSLAQKFSRHLGAGRVCVIEPSDTHFYQPYFTLVGGGLKRYDQSYRSTRSLLPSKAAWLQDSVSKFEPDQNAVITAMGDRIEYKQLVIAIGLELQFDRIKGLPEALQEDPQVCSNYSSIYVKKTFPAIQSIAKSGGSALFTCPTMPIKCQGAPQKIAYLADDYLRRIGKRSQVSIIYSTTIPAIFSVKRYADVLDEVCMRRNIQVNLKSLLIDVDHTRRTAVFENMDTKTRHTLPYAFLHAVPPQPPPPPLRAAIGTKLVNADGYVDVDQFTLTHKHYTNVWGVGDCIGIPSSKTAAAACTQARVVENRIKAALSGDRAPDALYTGYSSCPLITGKNKCILAEFGFDGKIMETTPLNQAKERRFTYWLKAHFMPWLYWNLFLPGWWNGPNFVRKLLHLGFVPKR